MITDIQTCPALPTEQHGDYFLPPDVILLTIDDGSARLLDMAGSFHAVSSVGARLLQETLASGPDAAVMRVSQNYGVAPQQVRDDLVVFLRGLEKQGLLCSRHGRLSRRGSFGLARLVLRPSLHAAHRLLRSPNAKGRTLLALARLSCALFGWARTVAVWQDAHAHLPARQADERDAETIQALNSAVRAAAASHPVAVACKERALCSWSLARAAGLHASVVVGIALSPMAGHCWCEVGAQTVGEDDREHREYFYYRPVARWNAASLVPIPNGAVS
jgi:hypothetical protein